MFEADATSAESVPGISWVFQRVTLNTTPPALQLHPGHAYPGTRVPGYRTVESASLRRHPETNPTKVET
eukprot:1516143-Rhodomonas_salina.1